MADKWSPEIGKHVRIVPMGIVGLVVSMAFSIRKQTMCEIEYVNRHGNYVSSWYYEDNLAEAAPGTITNLTNVVPFRK